jgi:uncharacterized protein (DUF58 family)
MLVGSVLAGPLLFSLIYGRWALRRFTVTRSLPEQLHVDQRFRVEVVFANLRRWLDAWAITVEDRVQRQSDVPAPRVKVGVYFPQVRAGQSRQVNYEGRLPERGLHRFGPLRVSTRFPLGLVQHSVVIDDEAELLVHPKLGRLTQAVAAMTREHESGGQRMTRRGLLEADFYGLREWRTGDSRRWIHWRTSARRGALIVRQFEQRRSQNLAVLVDLWVPSSPTGEQLATLETAISFVATLVADVCRKPGARLQLELAAREPLSYSAASAPVFREQMDSLALVQPHHAAAFPATLGYALARVPASTPTLLISTRPVDWPELARAGAERGADLSNRKFRAIDVSSHELAEYFQP